MYFLYAISLCIRHFKFDKTSLSHIWDFLVVIEGRWLAFLGTTEFVEAGLQIFVTLADMSVKTRGKWLWRTTRRMWRVEHVAHWQVWWFTMCALRRVTGLE